MQVKKNIAAEVSDRFRLPAPTGISPVGKSPPLAFSHLRCDQPDHGKSKHVGPEDGYVIHIALREVADAQLWLNGRDCAIRPLRKSGVLMGHLESDPVIAFHSAFDFVRFYIAKATLDELAEGSGRPRPFGLRRPEHGASDPVLYHLAASAASLLARGPDSDQLLLDHLASPGRARPCGGRLQRLALGRAVRSGRARRLAGAPGQGVYRRQPQSKPDTAGDR